MMNDIAQLREQLAVIQEPFGYHFNSRQDQVESLLRGLLANRQRYGYMSCPCRLASAHRENDRDIVLPQSEMDF